MTPLVETLNSLTPVLAITSMALFMTLERWLPYFQHGVARGRQRWRNIGIVLIGFLINAVPGSFLALPVAWSEANGFGLVYRLAVWQPLAVVIGIFLIDLGLYVQRVVSRAFRNVWTVGDRRMIALP